MICPCSRDVARAMDKPALAGLVVGGPRAGNDRMRLSHDALVQTLATRPVFDDLDGLLVEQIGGLGHPLDGRLQLVDLVLQRTRRVAQIAAVQVEVVVADVFDQLLGVAAVVPGVVGDR